MYNRIYNDSDWEQVNPINKDIMNDFILEYTAQKKKESTLIQYKNDIRIILIYILKNCNNKPITQLRKKDFRNLSLWFSNGLEMSNARTNRLMSCCRSLLSYVEEEDDYEYENNVAKKVKGLPKENVREIVFLPDELILKLSDKLKKEKRFKEATLLALLYDSCGRKNEVYQVTKESFYDSTKNSTNKVVGKRGKIFSLIYFDLTKENAALYLNDRGEDNVDSMWVSGVGENVRPVSIMTLYDWTVGWRKDLKEIDGNDYLINCHSFRHSGLENFSNGTHYVCRQNGMGKIPLEKLKLIANHSDLSTTESYLKDKTTDELEELFDIKIDN